MKKIVIIEDDEIVLELEKRLLEQNGYSVSAAKDSNQGIALVGEVKPDLIILDIRLPCKKKGIGAAKIMRKSEATRTTPILFVTGYLEGEESGEIKTIPNCRYITKPFDIGHFLKTVKELC